MVVTAARPSSSEGKLRPMNPARDLRTIAALIQEAFANELDERARTALRELYWMGRLWPFVWWWAQADPSFQDAFNGVVWEEPVPGSKKGQIVGNVSLNRAPGSRERWILCNVVVRPDFQGRGIGRKLTQAAIKEARALGAAGILLQVRENNAPAFHLYRDLGFRPVGGETEMILPEIPPVAILAAPGYEIRRWQPGDGDAIFTLATVAVPEADQWLKPIRASHYRPDHWTRMGEWIAALLATRRTYRLVALQGKRLVAVLSLSIQFRSGYHTLDLLVHPDHAGLLEPALISRALHILEAAPPRPVKATVSQGHPHTRSVLGSYGFKERETLLTLRMEFSQEGADAQPWRTRNL